MAYGHAERNLEAVRCVVAETITLLRSQPKLKPAEREWLAMNSSWQLGFAMGLRYKEEM